MGYLIIKHSICLKDCMFGIGGNAKIYIFLILILQISYIAFRQLSQISQFNILGNVFHFSLAQI